MVTEIVSATEEVGPNKETLFLFGGVALVIFGVGLVLANPILRRYLKQLGLGDIATAALPEMERLFRIRSM